MGRVRRPKLAPPELCKVLKNRKTAEDYLGERWLGITKYRHANDAPASGSQEHRPYRLSLEVSIITEPCAGGTVWTNVTSCTEV